MSGDHRSFMLAERNKESFMVEMRNVLIIQRNSYKRTFGRSTPMWGDRDVPKFGVYFCHPISRIFGPFIERHGYVPDFWVGFRNLQS